MREHLPGRSFLASDVSSDSRDPPMVQMRTSDPIVAIATRS